MESSTIAVPHDTLGALLVGVALSTIFYGVMFMQTCMYYMRFPDDSLWLKGVVAAVLAMQTTNVALLGHASWHYLVDNRGLPDTIEVLVWSAMFPTLLNVTSATLIHLFFIRQVFIMSGRNWYLACCIFLMSITQCALGWALVFLGLVPMIRQESRAVQALVPSSFAITAATDVSITLSLVYYLQFRKTNHERTDNIVNRLIVMSVNNGLLSSTIALAAFVCVFLDVGYATIALCHLLGKAYGNSLLASLNSRKARREALSDQLRRSGSRKTTKKTLTWNAQSHTATQDSDTVELTHMRPSSPGVLVTKEVARWSMSESPPHIAPRLSASRNGAHVDAWAV
ncbi:hypothetical protein BD626DRAFT_473357 [Schizophyllum amplum]|uniref:DUF6534 domain-containing protein n=1 Tax=Schizophyllum amplum TaxID=97359 RepID=A0A550CWR9_9AGAR|nr:hypothetical protein BD626DRAFT_473357 [Auriculariopsis ampla]